MSEPVARSDRDRFRGIIFGLLGLGLIVRAWLVWQGGQEFWPDEGRYRDAVDAVNLLAEGDARAGFARAVGGGDHPGFKLLGMIPAALARAVGSDDPRLPAAFFAAFSWIALLVWWGCLRRWEVPPLAQCWAMALTVGCTTLTYYSRHLLPYDAALALALGALFVGSRQPASWVRGMAAGFLVAAAALVYLGYWVLAGAVALLVLLRQRRGAGRGLGFAGGLLAGGLLTLGTLLALDRWSGGTLVRNAGKFAQSINQGDFGHGARVMSEYFWHAEGVAVLLWAAGLAWIGLRIVRHDRKDRPVPDAWLLALAGAGFVLTGLLAGDALHRFVVYGRTARQVVPFIALAAGLLLAEWPGSRRPAAWIAALLLAVNFARQLSPALAMTFPLDFKRRAEALSRASLPADPDRSYDRLVNVDQYVFAPEGLPYEPEATLLAARHPYEFQPYLYEGLTARQRTARRAADQRMRLVRMRVPDALVPTGQPHGAIRMRIKFPETGMSEPILAVGPREAGALFFVRYPAAGQLAFGLELLGEIVLVGDPIPYQPGWEYELELFIPAFLPPAESATELQRGYAENLISVRLDGREGLRQLRRPRVMVAEPLHVGYNFVKATSAVSAFSGEILAVRRGGVPAMREGPLGFAELGAVRVLFRLAPEVPVLPEPLVVTGVPGAAALGYLRRLAADRIKVGLEIWGIGAYESEAISVSQEKPIEVVYHCPSFFPPPGAKAWGSVPPERQAEARRTIRLAVDGATVLAMPSPAEIPPTLPVAYGRNPVGGSLVGERFGGETIQISRLPLASD